MKKRCRLWCAALCLLLLCACGQKIPAPTPEEPPEPEPKVPQVISLECSDGELTLRFHRGEDGAWLWTDDVSFPLDGRCVDEMLDDFAALETLVPLTDAEGPEAYGLYDAQKYITTRLSDGTSTTYRFGNESEAGAYYTCSDDAPDRICLASGQLLQRMGRSIYDMALLPTLPAIGADQVQYISVTRGDRTDRITGSPGAWRINNNEATDTQPVEQLLSLLAQPVLTQCVDYAPSDGAAALCGLEPPAAVLEAGYNAPSGDQETFTLTVGAVTDDGEACYVTVNDDTTLYLMDAAPLAVLRSWGE